MKKMLLVLTIMIQFVGCNSENDKYTMDISTKPIVDLSTPDKTVESFLNYKIWADTSMTNVHKEFFLSAKEFNFNTFYKPIRDSLTNKQLKTFADAKVEAIKKGKIAKVDIESDTRAMVIFNTGEFTYQNKPIINQFTLTKENNNWYIKIIERTCGVCDGSGKIEDFDNYSLYKKSYIPCEYCKGDGWTDVVNYEY